MDRTLTIVAGDLPLETVDVTFDPSETSLAHAAELAAEDLGYTVDFVDTDSGLVYVLAVEVPC